MATYTKFQPFVEHLGSEIHDFDNDQLVIALSATAPTNTWATLSQVSQIDYTNLSSRNVTTSDWSQTSGTAKLTCADLTLTASGAVATFRWMILFNDTSASDYLIAYWDRGADLSMVSGDDFVVDFDGTNGVLTIA